MILASSYWQCCGDKEQESNDTCRPVYILKGTKVKKTETLVPTHRAV